MSDLSLRATKNKTNLINFNVYQSDGTTPWDLTGGTLYFYAALGSILISKSSPSGGITITDAANGEATLQLDPADTSSFGNGLYAADCELTLAVSGKDYDVAKGSLIISPNVSTP